MSSREFHLALATLRYAELSEYVSNIAILITDKNSREARFFSKKITIYSHDFGSGYNISVPDGGYDQVSARNFLIDKLSVTDVDWIMMHDADDIYSLDFYRFISKTCSMSDAVTCSCFTLRNAQELCIPQEKSRRFQDKTLYDPHTRVWRKSLMLRYEKSEGIENYFSNHSRHCGVIFPGHINISYTEGLFHFHLHALLNKRHSGKISNYSSMNRSLPEEISIFLEENKGLFS